MRATRYPLLIAKLRSYFYSGWAFLMPYLFVYLLYYVIKWPVNPAGKTQNPDHQISNGYIPCMLHVYWALHAIHVILAGFALWSWWANERRAAARLRAAPESGTDARSDPTQSAFPPLIVERSALSVERSPLGAPYPLPTTRYSLLTALAPWALLALIFYIPGVYLEWPSDPWEHLRRINEWRILDTVGAHSSWMKSAYFIPYSLLSWCIGLRQLFWLDFYYTGICLLLCWQYYKFSRACGLGERSSMVFVIIQALLFGNNIFSFYRYYGISSSIYAQLGAVALTRIFLEWAARGTKPDLVRLESSDEARQCGGGGTRGLRQAARPERSVGLSERVPTGRDDNNSRRDHETPNQPGQLAEMHIATPLALGFWHLPSVLWLLASCSLLLALTAFNHPQGIGIAALGVAAIIIWRLIEWKRSALWWLIGGTLIINALFLWLYHRPTIIETYRAQGYLNAWYGFNILDLSSPAGDRMLQIVSAFGIISVITGVFILVRNHVIAWLTFLPYIALSLPCFTVPFAEQAYRINGETNIVTFQRLLLAIPPFLALLALLFETKDAGLGNVSDQGSNDQAKTMPTRGLFKFELLCITISAVVVTSNSRPSYNRFWNCCAITPNDLQLHDFATIAENEQSRPDDNAEPLTITPSAGNALTAYIPIHTPLVAYSARRTIGLPAIKPLQSIIKLLDSSCTKLAVSGINPDIRNDSNSGIIPLKSNVWNFISGAPPPEFIAAENSIINPELHILQSPQGKAIQTFYSAFFRVGQLGTYKLEITIRQTDVLQVANYLAVAWYDANEKLLESQLAAPQGAGSPVGWSNGTYSYFGLTAESAPTNWTTYTITFGLDKPVHIPEQALYMKVGALLNIRSTPNAVVQISKVRLTRDQDRDIRLLIPRATSAYTSSSTAAQLSMHWPTQQVNIDRAGKSELEASANAIRNR